MMMLRPLATVATLTLISGSVSAEFSGTPSLTSDYDYRGFSQTAEGLAIQASLDYQHASGFYASAWGSSLDWGQDSDADIEIDFIAGFSRDFGDSGISWDAGYLAYTYPGLSSANFGEFYGGLSWNAFSVKLSYSDDFAGVGQSAWYIDGGYSYAWQSGWSVLVYGGYSFGDAFDVIEPFGIIPFGNPDYWNYGAGVGYAYSDLYVEAKVVGTDLSDHYKIDRGVFANDFRGIFSVTLSLP
jgi:uncharacterized protein (TIGR02001 family)